MQNFIKISTFGVDFDQYFYVSVDFVLNTQIKNIGQNHSPKLIFFRDCLNMVKRNYTFSPKI